MNDIKELVKKAANGDRAAFDSLYEQTKNGVWFTCISILNNEENAKDIMQDTYFTAFKRLGTLSDPAAVQSWLNKVAANKCKNHLAAKSNSAVENGEDVLDNIPDDRLIPEEYVEDKAKRELIMKIIKDALSEDQYRTIILYYFNEMTAAEIAGLMGCHEKTVLYRLKTARLKIKEEVTRYEKENRDKLHAIAPMLSLSRLLRAESENTSVPNIAPAAPQAPVNAPPENAPNVPSEPAASAAKTGGKTMLNSLKSKIIAGACAAAVVGGGVTAGVIISNNSKNKTESRPAVSASVNASKPVVSQNTTSSNAGQSKPETSTPDVTDKVKNPEIEGLTAVELKRREGDKILPDIASGNIKEMRRSNTQGYLLLMNDGEIVYYCFNEGTDPFTVSFGKDTGISKLENYYFQDDVTTFTLLIIDGKNIFFKVVDDKGEVCLSNNQNPRQITGVLEFGDDVADIAVTRFGEIFAFDADGLGFEVKNLYSQYYESIPDSITVIVHKDNSVFYYPPETKGQYFLEMKVKKLVGTHFITDEGKVYESDGSGMIFNTDPIEYLTAYSFKDLYHDSSSNNYNLGLYSGVTDDDKIITFNTTTSKILFNGDKPDGTIQNIWQSVQRVVVKTDKGIFAADYNDDTEFKPIKALNGIDEEVIYLNGRYVLLGNGVIYTIDEYKW